MAYVYVPYPKMLYRNGEHLIVEGYGQQLEAVAQGWGLTLDWTHVDAPADPLSPPAEPLAALPESSVDGPDSDDPDQDTEASVGMPFFKRGRGRPRKT